VEKRAAILSIVIALSFFAVVFRLVDIMLLNHERFSAKAKSQQTTVEAIPVKRGIIFDRKGRELAINVKTESVYLDPYMVVSPDMVASALSGALGKRTDIILDRMDTNRRFNWIERKLPLEQTRSIRDLNLNGVGFVAESKRFYPKGSLASHIIGFVNIDNKGLEGIERRYDQYLTAIGEKANVFRDARGNILSEGFMREIRGNNLFLTIDEGLQHIVEKNLDEAIVHWQAASATAIMMDPYTGEILAMANRPTFDPNDIGASKASDRRNRAITDLYEPASTFKIITGVAALEEGIVEPDTKLDYNAGYISVGGRRIRDIHRHKHDVITFTEVIQKSSNVGTIIIAQNLGEDKMYEYINRFGFGQRTGIDLIGEVPGTVRPPERWSGVSLGFLSIGYEILVTPLQILRAYSAIANGGFLVRPHVVSEIRSPDGEVLYKTIPDARRIVSANTAKVFREILKTVTEEGGTALKAAVDGNQVAGKTGTTQLIDPKTNRYSKEKYASSFVGFVPADAPKIVMIVVIHEPKGEIFGGRVAGPVFRKIASESLSYMNVPREDYREKGLLLVGN
jgi:cell division protein FtsI (penicillin-binding protein 3)